jgi:ankyrin repeat protein
LDLEKLAHPLYYTALEGALQLTDFLIENGAEVNECSAGDEYETAIKAASFSGHEKIVQLLIGKGANVNAKGGMYGTALHEAAGRGSENIVQFLLDNGSDINAQGGEYGNAIQAAVANNQTNIAHLLLLRGAKLDSPVEQWDEMVKRLETEEGTSPDSYGKKQGNRLQIFRGNPDRVSCCSHAKARPSRNR